MSTWIEPKPEDIEIEDGEVIIYRGHDEFGNNYVSIPLDVMKEKIEQAEKGE